MPDEQKTKLRLEIAHVLFIDIVGYSKLRTTEQSAHMEKLRTIVRATDQFRTAEAEGKLLRLPTGDGGALVFRNLEAPVLCAVEIAHALRGHPELRVRMGIHSGPVNEVTDLNEQANIAGAGINIAQRVMDCGDAGHILVSKHAAEDLEQYDQWQPYLHDLGECEVKHGERLEVVNFYDHEIGNAAMPNKFSKSDKAAAATQPGRSRYSPIALGLGALIVVGAAALFFASRTAFRTAAARVEPALASAAAVSDKSIAVLPFENLSRDPDNAYFTDGIQDEILTRLSKIAALKVISRTSTQKYKSAPDNLRDIGRQLGVANLLEGSVQKVANAVHVNVQLIRAANDEHLWAESYNRKLDDVFGVEGEVASAIADQLKTKLSGAEQKAVAEKPTQNAAAYDVYLHAVAIDDAATLDVTKQAAPLYAEAARLDPQFALAWARLSIARSQLYFNGVDPQTNTGAKVKEEADRAIALQPELGEAWLAQGVYRYRVLRDFQGALQSYQEALRRLPNSPFVLEQMAHLERRLGQFDTAQKHYEAAAQLDPRNIGILSTVAATLQTVRRFDDAQTALDRVLEISPGNESVLASKAAIFQGQGRLKEAAEVLAKIPANSTDDGVNIQRFIQLYDERRFDAAVVYVQHNMPPSLANDPRTITFLGLNQKLSGKTNEARDTLMRAVAAMKPTPDAVVPVDTRELPCFLALAYAGLGEKDKALEQARQAVADYATDALAKPLAEAYLAIIQAQFGDIDSAIAALPHLLEVPNGESVGGLRVNPLWDPLRSDPRFQKLCSDK